MSWGACIETSKPIAFRPTPKAKDYIKQELRKHPKKKPSEIINDALETIADQTKSERGTSLQYRVLLVCSANKRLVTKDYCLNARMDACADCLTGDALILGLKQSPLDIKQPKKEE